jgi:diguanylate cyclase (GGDEF)-like protein
MPAIASFGTGDGAALLEASLGPPDSRPFRALTLNWNYPPALEGEEVAYRSGLVVPIVEDGVETGALAAYARGAAAFRPEHARALQALADDAAPGISNARRFAEAELRAVTDGLTGVRNRRGYDEELDRELARARRTGRPLSLLLLDLDDFADVNSRFDYPGGDLVLQEFADLLERAARATDTVCRRGGEEFGILLPETTGDEARLFYVRLRDEVATTGFSNVGRLTFSAGLVEWRPNETVESLDARVSAAVNRAKRAGKDRLEADWP